MNIRIIRKLKHKQDKELILMKKKHAKEQCVLGEQQSKIDE